MSETHDLVVIGGGPAGAATAIIAQTFGLQTLVLEAEQFPRHKVGESLVQLWPFFERFGVADEMDTTFQHKRGSCRVWGTDDTLQWTNFETGIGAKNYSLQVERSCFDLMLLQRAEAMGAVVQHGHRVESILWAGERAVGVKHRDQHGATQNVHAPWIVDASGRRGIIPREKQLRKVDPFYPDLSVYGYFRDADRFEGEHEGNLLIEAVPWGWFWFIPLHTGEVSVGLVCDQSTRQRLRQQGLASYFQEAIGQSSLVRNMLKPATLTRGPMATASYGYASTRYAGSGWFLAGDSGSFTDPMWATGVANALADGIMAATVVEAVESGRIGASDGIDYYHNEHANRIDYNMALVKFVYHANRLHGDRPFWTRRQNATLDGDLSPNQILRRLSRDPSIQYFRDAFVGMGLEDHTLAPLAQQLDRLQYRDRLVGSFFHNPNAWIPHLHKSVRLYQSLGIDTQNRLVKGLAINNDGMIEFAGNPFVAAAIEAIDGQRTAQEIITSVTAAAPHGKRLITHFELLATFVDAYERGVLDLRSDFGDH